MDIYFFFGFFWSEFVIHRACPSCWWWCLHRRSWEATVKLFCALEWWKKSVLQHQVEGSRKRRNWRNKRGSFQKHTSQAWQHISLIPAFGSQSQANLWVQLKAVLHRIQCQLSLYSLFMKNKTEEIKPRSTVGSNYLRERAFLCCGYSNDLQLSNSSWGYPSSDAEGLRGRRHISSYPSTHIHWLTAPYPISSAHLLASSSER